MNKKLLLLTAGTIMLVYGFVLMLVPFPVLQLFGFPLFISGGVVVIVVGLNLATQEPPKRDGDENSGSINSSGGRTLENKTLHNLLPKDKDTEVGDVESS